MVFKPVIRKIGMTEFCTGPDNKSYKRKVGTTKWILAENTVAPDDTRLNLSLVRQKQPPPMGYHWSLMVAREGSNTGSVYQVMGDHTHMTFHERDGLNVAATASYQDSFVLAAGLTQQQFDTIRNICRTEPPPSAPTQKQVKETCQAWALRCLSKMTQKGIVTPQKFQFAQSLKHTPSLNNKPSSNVNKTSSSIKR